MIKIKMPEYPLYDELLQEVQKNPDDQFDIKVICSTINNMGRSMTPEDSKHHFEEIFALILHHDIINSNGIPLTVTPYNPKIMTGGKGLLYNIMSLPPVLQRIIGRYLIKYSS